MCYHTKFRRSMSYRLCVRRMVGSQKSDAGAWDGGCGWPSASPPPVLPCQIRSF